MKTHSALGVPLAGHDHSRRALDDPAAGRAAPVDQLPRPRVPPAAVPRTRPAVLLHAAQHRAPLGPGRGTPLENQRPPRRPVLALAGRTLLLDRGHVVLALDDRVHVVGDTGLGPLDTRVWPCADGNLRGNPVAEPRHLSPP